MTEQELNEKISALITERDNFVANSNKMIGEFNGRINVYMEWLNSLAAKSDPPPDGNNSPPPPKDGK